MKRWLVYDSRAVGTEVDFSLARKSPVASWTGGSPMTLTGARGGNALEHASQVFLMQAPHAGGATVEDDAMEMLHERVAGLDVHKASIVACVRLAAGGQVKRECRTFETTTDGLEALRAWLTACRCTHVAMEATGVYWMPVWKILSEGDFALIVANAAHIKAVPGRKACPREGAS
jgi:hypothetical protein